MKHLLSIAPMMARTDRHYRMLMRIMSRHTLLYTEMLTTGAIIYGDRERFLAYDAKQHPLALQLGGSDPKALTECAIIAQNYGYDEVNLNVGCPSDRVQQGQFGACLMKSPQLVADCVAAMRDKVDIPVTVKTRIGVDDQDSYAELTHFIKTVANAGCEVFILHARKAWLKGLSPRENREIPPLRYDIVYQLKQDFPQLKIIINGGIKTLTETQQHLQHVDGVMLGREAYTNPYLFANVDQLIYGDGTKPLTRRAVVTQYLPYVAKQLSQGAPLYYLTRHLIGLFQGQPGAKHWRRFLSENSRSSEDGVKTIREAINLV